ncbi:putative bifunctional diguanylate cyclase/phosphodiesterase [Alkalicoccus saliphilus]|uniref:Two-component system response regulator n=1 Tax=Alkalicoccus saliphilus TaxID=200989 RepID=A0A2T4U470_9BACI|nr:GGDEF domain-containing phosphodiesterase [Alkalicoccus saliphilus]PTL38201.1 two-component system response regulator [Alkalicoccus saliphilus]
MKYIGRIGVCLVSIIITLIWIMYRQVAGTLVVTYEEIIIFTLLLQPFLWWLGKQYDKSKDTAKRQELQQKEVESLFNNSGTFLWTIDENEKKVIVSKGIEDTFGFSAEEFEQNFDLWISRTCPEDEGKVQEHYDRLLSGGPSKCEWRVFRKDGEIRWLEVFGNPIFDNSGHVIKLNGVAYDVTERKKMEEKLENFAYYDSLTGLPNRRYFKQAARKAIERCEGNSKKSAIMFIDLDRFKFINDTMGHDVGDELLKKVSHRISRSVRDLDVVARHGGDEFIILFEDIEEAGAIDIATRILDQFNSPFLLEGGKFFTTPSIGISMYPKDGKDTAALIKHADNAMYIAKERGKNNFQFYIYEDKDIFDRKVKIERGLNDALINGELELHYQPKVYLPSGKPYGVEALIRWKHPELGMIPPIEFISIAEKTGFIKKIGDWVIQEACAQAKSWKNSGLNVKMAVNVSSVQFEDDFFVEKIRQALTDSGLPPEHLGLEITESVMHDLERTTATLHELKRLGVKVSVDDFGTGYSSLNVLSSLPIDLVKIDQSFIREVLTDPNKASLVKSMITMVEDLEFDLIAEGIENELQVNFLTKNGCYLGQGYLYSPPLPAEEVEKILKQQLTTV